MNGILYSSQLGLHSGILDPSVALKISTEGLLKAETTPWYPSWQLQGEVLCEQAVSQKLLC